MNALSPCGEMVRQGDPVRFRTALFAPPDAREGLFALYAFNLEIAKIAPMVSEPMIGQIRLQWWRDSLDTIYAGKAVRRHEVVEPLCEMVRAADVPRGPFDALIDAREWDLDPDFPKDAPALSAYLRDTAGSLAVLGVRALGGAADAVAQDAGFGIGAARYLAAVPVLAMQGAKPLAGQIDWRAVVEGGRDAAFAEAVAALANEGRAAIRRARAERGAVPRIAAPALLETPMADRALAMLDGAQVLADLAAEPSPFRANFSRLWRGVTGRW